MLPDNLFENFDKWSVVLDLAGMLWVSKRGHGLAALGVALEKIRLCRVSTARSFSSLAGADFLWPSPQPWTCKVQLGPHREGQVGPW